MSYQFFRNSLLSPKTKETGSKKQSLEVGNQVVINGVLDDNSLTLTITENPNNDELELIHGTINNTFTTLIVSSEQPSVEFLTILKDMFKSEIYLFETDSYNNEAVFVLFLKRHLKHLESKAINNNKKQRKQLSSVNFERNTTEHNECYFKNYRKLGMTDHELHCSLILDKVKTIGIARILWGKNTSAGLVESIDARQYEFDLSTGILNLYIKSKDMFFKENESITLLHNGRWQLVPITYESLFKMQESELMTIYSDFD
jgi:hypothetical protein